MPTPPSLSALLDPARVGVGVAAATKGAALEAALDHVVGCPAVTDAARLTADVRARETVMSTGVGEGLAMPHARTPAVRATVATLCTLASPVDWDALDGGPVDVVLLFAGPENERAAHVKLLAHVSRVLSGAETRRRLAAARTPEALVQVVAEAEEGV